MICKNSAGDELQAWRVPPIGMIADEDIPDWMLRRMTDGVLKIDRLGGLLFLTPDAAVSSLPGDYMIFDHVAGDIKFCTETAFDEQYTVH